MRPQPPPGGGWARELNWLPIYQQIASHYQTRIEYGDLLEGTKLPSIVEMCGQWRIAQGTALAAVAYLRDRGLVETSRKGTFVRSGVSKHQQ